MHMFRCACIVRRSPFVVMPGAWTAKEIANAARHIAVAKKTNGGSNCLAAQVGAKSAAVASTRFPGSFRGQIELDRGSNGGW